MRVLLICVICTMLALVALSALSQATTAADTDSARTVIEGVCARAAGLPPLTVAGLYTAFYTPLYWIERGRGPGAAGEAAPIGLIDRGDRVAVGIVVWEGADRRQWERDFMGLYRGPNNWVSPAVDAPATMVADMQLREIGLPNATITLESRVTTDVAHGCPSVTVTGPAERPPLEAVHLYLGLRTPLGPFDRVLREALSGGDWRVGPVVCAGDTMSVSAAFGRLHELQAHEWTLRVAADSFEPLSWRQVMLIGPGRVRATEVRWGDYQAVKGADLRLPRSGTVWEFAYGFGEGPPLSRTRGFRCVTAFATPPGSTLSPVPLTSEVETALSSPDLLPLVGETYGAPLQVAAKGFAQATPPAPPEDLMSLDPTAAAEDMRKRYGLH
jgi:hypothetical protein